MKAPKRRRTEQQSENDAQVISENETRLAKSILGQVVAAEEKGSRPESSRGKPRPAPKKPPRTSSRPCPKSTLPGQLCSAPTETSAAKLGKYIGIDCEMVGVGPDGVQSVLARVSIVNFYGQVVMDELVKPSERVTDYRTWITGLRPGSLDAAPEFKSVQQRVSRLLTGRIVVGHGLSNDFACLLLSHPASQIRDTSAYKPFRKLAKGKRPSLKRLALHVLGLEIQTGVHSSVEDARVAMSLFRSVRGEWEAGHARQASHPSGK